MDSSKNKKKLSPKWSPGHDLCLTILMVVIVAVVTTIKACDS